MKSKTKTKEALKSLLSFVFSVVKTETFSLQ